MTLKLWFPSIGNKTFPFIPHLEEMKEWHQNLLNSPSHWILTRIPVGCHYYYRTVEGTEAQRSCHKARMVESGFKPGSDSFQSSCIVFPLHSAFPNEAAHQTHWKRPIKKYIFPDPTSDLFAQIFAVGPRNLYFKPWFLYRCLINVSLLNESSLKTGAMSVLFSDKSEDNTNICCVTECASFPALTNRPTVKSF